MLAFMSDILVKDRPGLVRVPIKNAPKFYISLIINKNLDNTTYFQKEFNKKMIELVEAYRPE